jgi:hypothetical protein
MKTVIATTFVAGAAAVAVETNAHEAMISKTGTGAKMEIYNELVKLHPNDVVMMRKDVDLGVDSWEAYQQKYQQGPNTGAMQAGDMTGGVVTKTDGEYDSRGNKLTPGHLSDFANKMQNQCSKLDPDAPGNSWANSIQTPWHSDFMQAWGLTAEINMAYGHLVITDQMINLALSCTNVAKQTAGYGDGAGACCDTVLSMCCAAHVNYEVMMHQLGYKYAYACQGLTGFPFGKKEITMKQCLAHGDQSWVQTHKINDQADHPHGEVEEKA